ncbi:MAG TPA: Spy/CpxP family protein refolding chaperone [Bryobacteraceae bacterium]|nr:Spy/CpxP family protein refolding chaperone [Bryobacteraceae bacterium]
MKQKLALLAALAAMSAGMLAAQGRGAGPAGQRTPPTAEQMEQMRLDRMTRMLNLTDAQKEQAKAFFATASQQSATLREPMQAAETALREAVKANNVATIDTSAAELGRLMGQMRAIHAKASAQLYSILTLEQRERWDNFGGGGMMGPGMGGMGTGMPGMGPGTMRRGPRQ